MSPERASSLQDTSTKESLSFPRRLMLQVMAAAGLATGGIIVESQLKGTEVTFGKSPERADNTQAPPSVEPTTGEHSSTYETSLREDIQKFIDAAMQDDSVVFTTDDGTEISRKDLLAHVTHTKEIGLAMQYFMDTFMITPKVQNAQSPHDEMEQKIVIADQELASWNNTYTTTFALIVDRVIASIQEDTAVSLQEGAAYTDHPSAKDQSQLRRLILYALDVTTGNQPQFPQEYQDKALKPFLKLLTDINPELLRGYLQQNSNLDVDGLIAYINENTFEEYDLDAMMDPKKQKEFQLSRRAFILPMGAHRQVRKQNKDVLREIVYHDLDNMK